MVPKLGIMYRQGMPCLYKLEKLAQFLIAIFIVLNSFSGWGSEHGLVFSG